ncbi:carbamoyltransferase HypF [Hippea maritima]|uniref:Carbamoyltransferase n=1 Tax=Hippea maritima (strain ATCC 700847 / DSM 10411 / MH2) TaxID=760142 RepID=F2LXG5_HIPMA|nr:carbamoyltransferase HypF [Hippea maritima]AEA34279.1 (NiFe) hydrogenase maturation protein HypF [Hippea maritima DSM 10411]
MKAFRIKVEGIVQSVGFRPFIYRLFKNCSGWVRNSSGYVEIYLECQTSKEKIKKLIKTKKPANSQIDSIHIEEFKINKRAFDGFFIKTSSNKNTTPSIPPDLSICDQCAKELFDEKNRRFLHPFINCTNCGARFSIITGAPYDRDKTTMRYFTMCKICNQEYNTPSDRRFHAQPICCNECGPEYFLINKKKIIAKGIEAIKKLSEFLTKGGIALVKGIGGYHLYCDAFNEDAIERVKQIKNRYSKPFAVIVRDINTLSDYCFMSTEEQKLIESQIKPIVLLRLKSNKLQSATMGSPYLGAMLPYTPLHLLIFHFSKLKFLIATSANFTEKPLIYSDKDAVNFSETDYVLTNNRRIIRPLEDSIVKLVGNKKLIYRYARGFAPGVYSRKTKPNILAVGCDLKNNIAVSLKDKVVLSQYSGDLEEYENYLRFKEKVDDFLNFFKVKPDIVVCDKHPNYLSSNYAIENFENTLQVQHHKAHFASVLFEHQIKKPCLGVVLDGTGFGDDAAIWGGEFFIWDGKNIERVGHLKYMPFAFSEKAVKEPFRLAILWLKHLNITNHPLFDKYPEITKAAAFIEKTETSSAGRLFDVAAVLLGIKEKNSYEAEAAVNLNYEAFRSHSKEKLSYTIKNNIVDFSPTIEQLVYLNKKTNRSDLAMMFHNTIIDAVFENILNISHSNNIKNIALSGGVFQNEIILSGIVSRLNKKGFDVYFNNTAPINDGGIALGQIWLANSRLNI